MWLTRESGRTVINDQWKEREEDKCYHGNQDLELNMPVTVTDECLCRNELSKCASLHKAVGLRRTQRVCDTLGTYTQHYCFMYWITSVCSQGKPYPCTANSVHLLHCIVRSCLLFVCVGVYLSVDVNLVSFVATLWATDKCCNKDFHFNNMASRGPRPPFFL